MAAAAESYSSYELEEDLKSLLNEDGDDRQSSKSVHVECTSNEPFTKDLITRFFEWIQKRGWIKDETTDSMKKKILGGHDKMMKFEVCKDKVVLVEDLQNLRQAWNRRSVKEKITSREVLKPGDHIAVRMKRSCFGPGQSWWNHMIVTSKDKHGTLYITCPCVPDENPDKVQFEADLVVNLTNLDEGKHFLKKPKLRVWETALPWRSVEEAVRYSYGKTPYKPEEVSKRALSKLDEEVDISTGTSEQFAIQIATGQVFNKDESNASMKRLQASTFKCMLMLAKYATQLGLKLLKFGLKKGYVASKFLRVISNISPILRVLQFVGFGIGLFFDVVVTAVEIGMKYGEYSEGKISKDEFHGYRLQALSGLIVNIIFAVISLLVSLATLPGIPFLGFGINLVILGLNFITERAVKWVVGKVWEAYIAHKTE